VFCILKSAGGYHIPTPPPWIVSQLLKEHPERQLLFLSFCGD